MRRQFDERLRYGVALIGREVLRAIQRQDHRLGDGTSWAGDKMAEPIIFLEAFCQSASGWGVFSLIERGPSSWGFMETDEIRGVSGGTQEKQTWHAGQPKKGAPAHLNRSSRTQRVMDRLYDTVRYDTCHLMKLPRSLTPTQAEYAPHTTTTTAHAMTYSTDPP